LGSSNAEQPDQEQQRRKSTLKYQSCLHPADRTAKITGGKAVPWIFLFDLSSFSSSKSQLASFLRPHTTRWSGWAHPYPWPRSAVADIGDKSSESCSHRDHPLPTSHAPVHLPPAVSGCGRQRSIASLATVDTTRLWPPCATVHRALRRRLCSHRRAMPTKSLSSPVSSFGRTSESAFRRANWVYRAKRANHDIEPDRLDGVVRC
jgi:hypothetical protein